MIQTTRFALSIAMLLVTVRAWAQPPTLVKDIYPGTTGNSGIFNENSRSNAVMNGILYFAADNSTHGVELWRTDGTEAGTYMVKDIYLGGRSASSDPQDFFVHKGILYFLANDNVNGYELWKSDGTEAGTTLLKDMRSGANHSNISHYAVINDEVQFWNTNTNELWKTNGTATGTVKLANLQTSGSFLANSAVVVKGVWYFQASNTAQGFELWRCDGTQAGMRIVKDINPYGSSIPTNLTNVNDVLYFSADDGVYGNELWKSDGTEAGTSMVKDFTVGGNSSNMTLISANTVLYIQLKNTSISGLVTPELWKSDGTSTGTVLIYSSKNQYFKGITQTQTIGNTLFFNFDNEVYRTDVSQIAVKPVTLPAIPEPGNPARTYNARIPYTNKLFTVIDNELHFLTYPSDSGPYIYQIDKISGADTVAQAVSSFSSYLLQMPLVNSNRRFYMTAFNPQAGYELHRVDVCSHTAKINTPNGVSFCPGSSVSITAEGVGATGGYTYNWKLGASNAGTNANLSVTKAGTYTVDIINQGCTVSTSVEIKETTNLPVAVSGTNTVCAGMAAPLSATVSGGVAPYVYQWRQSGSTVGGATTSTFSVTATGVYSVSVADSKGCTGTSSGFTVTVKPSPAPTITTATTSLTSGASTVLTTVAALGQTYQWYRNTQAIAGATNNTHTATIDGSYTVMVTRDGCSATSPAITLRAVLATEPTLTSLGLDVFPNPVQHNADVRLTMVRAAPATFTLVDAGGKAVGEWQSTPVRTTHVLTLPMKEHPAGVYFLRVDSGGLQAVRRVLKQ